MKTMKFSALLLCACFLLESCGMNNTAKGSLIGAGAGTALGALVGKLSGNTALGAGIGAVAGTAAGAIIGKKMDKAKAAAAKIDGATVTAETDAQGNTTNVKITLDGGVTFATGKSILNANSKTTLAKFAEQIDPQIDLAVLGFTDNTGSQDLNQKLSMARANAVADYLKANGVGTTQIQSVKGLYWQNPVASNETAEGRAQNRRVELYLIPSNEMISSAKSATAK